MKGRSLSVLGAVSAIAGVLLVLCHKAVSLQWLVMLFGAVFVIIGLWNLVFYSAVNADTSGVKTMSVVSNAASIVLGVAMLTHVGIFASMLPCMLSALLAVCALWQLLVLAIGIRPHQLPVWTYVFALLLVAGAIYIYIIRDLSEPGVVLLASGISLVVLGVGCVVEGGMLGVLRRRSRAESEANAASEGEEGKEPRKTSEEGAEKRP